MKKKFKLLTSIASLGLALAVMTFGVLAAINHSLAVSSFVDFSVGRHIAFEISGTATGGNAYDKKTILATDINSDKLTAWEAYTTDKRAEVSVDSPTLTWVFEIKNTGSNVITLSLADKVLPDYFAIETLELDKTSVAVGATETVTVTYTGSGDARQQTNTEAANANLTYTLKLDGPAAE